MLLGLDLASRLTGYCAGSGRELPEAGVWEFPKVDGDYGLLLKTLEEYLGVCFRRFSPTCVAYESPILITRGRGGGYGDNLGRLRLLYPLSAFVEWFCRKADVECYEVSLHDVKREITGNALAPKGDMVAVARNVGIKLPEGPGCEDAADAFAIWLMLLRANDRVQAEEFDKLIWGRKRLL